LKAITSVLVGDILKSYSTAFLAAAGLGGGGCTANVSDILADSTIEKKLLPVIYEDIMGDFELTINGNGRYITVYTRRAIPENTGRSPQFRAAAPLPPDRYLLLHIFRQFFNS
jgi:hypothetical protein